MLLPSSLACLRPRKAWFVIGAAVLSLCVTLVWPPGSAAQGPKGVVEGTLVNKTDSSIIPAGVEVSVISLSGGMSVIKSAKAGAAGRFRIEGLPTDSRLMVQANYKSVNYHQFANFDASGRARLEIAVYEATGTMNGVRLRDVRIAFQFDGNHLRCLESYSLENQTNPPRTVASADGTFRFSKAPGILEVPKMSVLAPGATFPLSEPPLESADGQSYYGLYPLRPGVTTIDVDQVLPYENRTYAYQKKFYQDIGRLDIGVIPQDMVVSGEGLSKIQTDGQRNFSIYSGGPIKADTLVVWTLSGGTPAAAAPAEASSAEPRITPMPTSVGQNALIIGPLLLMGFILVLWFSSNLIPDQAAKGPDSRTKALKERREQLINYLAILDHRFENHDLDPQEHSRLRELGKGQLRRIAALLGKSQQ
jgi:hypothetical protein